MTELYGHVLEAVFFGFLRRDPEILQSIDAFEGDLKVHGEALEFTLPALYEFARQTYARASGQAVSDSREGYLRFRKALYKNPTNSRLMALGGRVKSATPNPNHDLVVFRLVRTGEAC